MQHPYRLVLVSFADDPANFLATFTKLQILDWLKYLKSFSENNGISKYQLIIQELVEITLELWMWLAGSMISLFETFVSDIRSMLFLGDSEKRNMHFISPHTLLTFRDNKKK